MDSQPFGEQLVLRPYIVVDRGRWEVLPEGVIARAGGLSIAKEGDEDDVILLWVQTSTRVLGSGYEPLVAAGDVPTVPRRVEDGRVGGRTECAVGDVSVWDDGAGEEGEVAEAVGEHVWVSLFGSSRGHGGGEDVRRGREGEEGSVPSRKITTARWCGIGVEPIMRGCTSQAQFRVP